MIEHKGNWEKRWHPLRREWVVYAAHRNHRPWSFEERSKDLAPVKSFDPNCYLCPSVVRNSGISNPAYDGVFVFQNDFPVVGMDAPSVDIFEGPMIRKSAKGIAKVICFSPDHEKTLAQLPISSVVKVVEAWRDQTLLMKTHADIHSALIFENKGELVGVSNPHPHSQMYAVDFPFKNIEIELQAIAAFRQSEKKSLCDELIAFELASGERVIAENDHAVAFVPFFARYAYEVLIFPKKRHQDLCSLSHDEIESLGLLYREVVQRFDLLFAEPFPYVMNIHQAPVNGSEYPFYHMYFHFQPPLRQPGLAKFLAGPEIGAGNFMADTMPEHKAAELKGLDLNRFSDIYPER